MSEPERPGLPGFFDAKTISVSGKSIAIIERDSVSVYITVITFGHWDVF
jgi:hypothetical protein